MSLIWTNLTAMESEVTYMVAQVKRNYVILVLDIDDPFNYSMLRRASLLMQIETTRLLNPLDKVKVKSYEVAQA